MTRMTWTRHGGAYTVRIGGHVYEVRRFPGYPTYPLPVWEVFCDGEKIGGARRLDAAKEMAANAARADAGPRSAWKPGDPVLY